MLLSHVYKSHMNADEYLQYLLLMKNNRHLKDCAIKYKEHCENMPIQIYRKFHLQKLKKSDK